MNAAETGCPGPSTDRQFFKCVTKTPRHPDLCEEQQ